MFFVVSHLSNEMLQLAPIQYTSMADCQLGYHDLWIMNDKSGKSGLFCAQLKSKKIDIAYMETIVSSNTQSSNFLISWNSSCIAV